MLGSGPGRAPGPGSTPTTQVSIAQPGANRQRRAVGARPALARELEEESVDGHQRLLATVKAPPYWALPRPPGCLTAFQTSHPARGESDSGRPSVVSVRTSMALPWSSSAVPLSAARLARPHRTAPRPLGALRRGRDGCLRPLTGGDRRSEVREDSAASGSPRQHQERPRAPCRRHAEGLGCASRNRLCGMVGGAAREGRRPRMRRRMWWAAPPPPGCCWPGAAPRQTLSASSRPGRRRAARTCPRRRPPLPLAADAGGAPLRACHRDLPGALPRSDREHPDPTCTPGAVQADVTQASIASTICRHGWTATVRAPEAETGKVKKAAMLAYGLPASGSKTTELDHFVPLELGGANDVRNLWPEPSDEPGHGVANTKDKVENDLNAAVCRGQVPLLPPSRPSPRTGRPPSNTSACRPPLNRRALWGGPAAAGGGRGPDVAADGRGPRRRPGVAGRADRRAAQRPGDRGGRQHLPGRRALDAGHAGDLAESGSATT